MNKNEIMKTKDLIEKDLKEIYGGGEDGREPHPEASGLLRDMVLDCIEQGNALMAKGIYEASYWDMIPADKEICQVAFYDKFGYEIS